MTYLAKALTVCLTAGLLSAQPPGRGAGPPAGRGRGGQQNGQQTGQPNGTQSQLPATKPEDLGSIEGQVLNAATGEPLKKASVTLRALNGRGQTPAVSSDTSGRFSLTGVEPGRYRLFAERNGFVRQEYGARGPERTGTALTVD